MANTKLYIGGLNYRMTEDEFRAAFEKAGTVVSASIIMDRMTNRSRGFGFVEMADEAMAEAAIAMWDGKELDGRMLSVSHARPQGERTERPRSGGFGGGNRGGFNNDRGGYGSNY